MSGCSRHSHVRGPMSYWWHLCGMVVNPNVDLSGAIQCKLNVKLDGYVLQFCNEVGLHHDASGGGQSTHTSDIILPYQELCLITQLVSPPEKDLAKKLTPHIFFQCQCPLGHLNGLLTIWACLLDIHNRWYTIYPYYSTRNILQNPIFHQNRGVHKIFFTACGWPVAGLTNWGHVRDYRAGAPCFPRVLMCGIRNNGLRCNTATSFM